MMYDCTLNGFSTIGELDPGASHAYMSSEAADLYELTVTKMDLEVGLGDNSVIKSTGKCTVPTEINRYRSKMEVYILPMFEKSNNLPYVVFGRKWLELDNPRVDWETNCIYISCKMVPIGLFIFVTWQNRPQELRSKTYH